MKKRIVGLFCAVALLVSGCAFGAISSEWIELAETGAHGGDATFSSDSKTTAYGHQDASAWNTLYVGAQERGFYNVGGVAFSTAVGPDGEASKRGTISGKYHVILDPSGPMANGCKGYGHISQ